MAGGIKLKRALTLLSLIILTHWTPAGHAENGADAITPYEVTYRATRSGASIDTTSTLSYDNDTGEWVFETSSDPRGIAAIFVKSVPTEVTRFVVEGGELRPLDYGRVNGAEQTKSDTQVVFDWAAGKALAKQGQTRAELDLEPGTMSPVTADLTMRVALRNGAERVSFPVLEGGQLRQYDYQPLGEGGKQNTAIGAFETIKYQLTRSGSKRELVMWLAPELDFLPVYMEQIQDGKRKYRFEIQALEGIGQPQQ